MGICPNCGSFVDEGEPYCPYCSYTPGNDYDDSVRIDGEDYNVSDVEDILRRYGYNLYDLEHDLIDDGDFEDILYDLRYI